MANLLYPCLTVDSTGTYRPDDTIRELELIRGGRQGRSGTRVLMLSVVLLAMMAVDASADRTKKTQPARSPWTKPVRMAGTSLDTTHTETDVAGDGASFTAIDGGPIRGFWRSRKGRVLKRVQVSPGGADEGVALAVGESGTAAVAWTSRSVLYARTITRTGALGPVVQLSGTIVNNPQGYDIAVTASDRVVVAWGTDTADAASGAHLLSTFQAGATTATATTLASGSKVDGPPALAVDGVGRVLVAWASGGAVFSTAVDANGAFRPGTAMSEPGRVAANPRVSLNNSGRGYVLWAREPYPGGQATALEARSADADGAFGPRLALSRGFVPGYFGDTDVATFHDGTGVVVAARRGRETEAQILSPTAAGKLMRLSPKSERFSGFPKADNVPRVVAAGRRATVLWRYGNGKPYKGRGFAAGIRSRSLTLSGRLGAVTTIQPFKGVSLIDEPALGGNEKGQIAAAWDLNQIRGGSRRGVSIFGSHLE